MTGKICNLSAVDNDQIWAVHDMSPDEVLTEAEFKEQFKKKFEVDPEIIILTQQSSDVVRAWVGPVPQDRIEFLRQRRQANASKN